MRLWVGLGDLDLVGAARPIAVLGADEQLVDRRGRIAGRVVGCLLGLRRKIEVPRLGAIGVGQQLVEARRGDLKRRGLRRLVGDQPVAMRQVDQSSPPVLDPARDEISRFRSSLRHDLSAVVVNPPGTAPPA